MLKKLWSKRAIKLIIVCLSALVAFLVFDFYTSGTTYGSNSAAAQTPSDLIAPTISGDAAITMERGTEFKPTDYFAVSDDQDENPTLEVQTPLDTNNVAVTPVLLIAKDETGNTSTKQVTVNIIDSKAEAQAKAEKERIEKEKMEKEAAAKKEAEEVAAQQAQEAAQAQENNANAADTAAAETQSPTTTSEENGNINSQANNQQAATNNENTSETPVAQSAPATIQPMQLEINGKFINYQNAGQGSGQAVIDSDHSRAATWGGSPVQSGDDGLNTHIIAHNPGAFDVIFTLGIGSQFRISDASGKVTTYTVNEITQVDDEAYRLSDGADYWDKMIGTGGGERVTLQACINDIHNLVVFASK